MYQLLFLFMAESIPRNGCATVLVVLWRRPSELCSIIMSKAAVPIMGIPWLVHSSITNAVE